MGKQLKVAGEVDMREANIPAGSPSWDDEMDLRRYVAVLVRHKWIILAFLVATVAVTGAVNYAVLPAVYESSGVVSLPPADSWAELRLSTPPETWAKLRMTTPAYAKLASSEGVLERVRDRLGAELPGGVDLRSRYRFSLDAAATSLTATASAPNKEQAATLAKAWMTAFNDQTEAEVVRRFTPLKDSATQEEASLQLELARTEGSLSRSEREGNLSIMSARLRALEQELVAGEVRLRQITSSSIPLDEARLAFVQKTLDETPQTLQAPLATPAPSTDAVIANPVRLQLSQEWVTTSVRLAVSRKEAETLTGSIPILEKDAQQLRAQIVDTQEAQSSLTAEVKRLDAAYTAATNELELLLKLEGRIAELAGIDTIQEPSIPAAPVSPQRWRNVVLAGVLGTFLAAGLVLLWEWYRGQPQTSLPPLRETPPDASPEEFERPRRQPVG